MKKVELKDLRRMAELKRKLIQRGWDDSSLKGEYCELLKKVHGGLIRNKVHPSYDFIVLDVEFCACPTCEGMAVLSSPQAIMEWPECPRRISCAHLSELEEIK